jgi:LysR family transcriptional regulator, regulator of abg operon
MKLHQLRNVGAIAKHGSLRAAARALGLAQPTLTRSIHELEHELGAPLFERKKRGVSVTPVGEAFVRRANVILADVQRAREEAEQISGGVRGSLVAGLSIAAHLALLPRSLQRFRNRYPDVRLRIIEGFFPTLESGLLDGSIDFYMGPRPEASVPEGLVIEKLFDNTRAIVCRSGHPLAKTAKKGVPISLADLTEVEWVTTSITHLADDELGVLFNKQRLPPPRLVAQTQSALSLIMMLLYSDMLAMVPVQFTEFVLAAQAVTSIPVKESLPAPAMVLIRRSGLPLTPAAEYFGELLRTPRLESQPGQQSPGNNNNRSSFSTTRRKR